MRIKMVGATDVGRRRKANQDSLFYDEALGIGIVADGIGGRNGGEVASSMAVNGMRKAILAADRIRHEEMHPFLTSTVDVVNKSIIKRGQQNPDINGMGTTLNCLMFNGNQLSLVHIGDSRTYLFYKNHFYQMTLDHNVKTFVERGWLSNDRILPGSTESALVRAMGLFDNCEVDIYDKKIQEGEIYITASDGLFDMVKDGDISKMVADNQDNISVLPKLLIDAANRKGGRDNITVLISKVEGS